MSDVYNPKYVFTFGFGALGIFSIGAGFVNEKIGLITLRAITGVCKYMFCSSNKICNFPFFPVAAFTIPSALSLIVHIFPEPREQGMAIAVFGGAGSYGSSTCLLPTSIGPDSDLNCSIGSSHWCHFHSACLLALDLLLQRHHIHTNHYHLFHSCSQCPGRTQ
jgi:MFS family permease